MEDENDIIILEDASINEASYHINKTEPPLIKKKKKRKYNLEEFTMSYKEL